jgi:hypothetical protein
VTETPNIQAVSEEIARQVVAYLNGPDPDRPQYNDDFLRGLEVAVAVAVHPHLEHLWALAAPSAAGILRPCACGCGQPVTSPRPEARYATGACRVRAHRAGA